jgi:cobalt/nickel transport system permease protein
MHIPDGFLAPRIWGPLDLVSGSLVAVGVRRVATAFEEKAIPLMGVLAAFVFAGQMINIPVAGGTSGHFLGGALVGALLGPWAGLIVISVVLMIQCFVFQDGGVAALGANIFNMGVLGAMGGALLYETGRRMFHGRRAAFWSGFWAGWIAMVVSAASCASELALSKVVSWSTGLSVIVGLHTILGFVEGIVTAVVLDSLARSRPDLFRFGTGSFLKRDWVFCSVLIVSMVVLGLYSSKAPDAVQRLAGHHDASMAR